MPSDIANYALLIVGGQHDPHIALLNQTALNMGQSVFFVTHDNLTEPEIVWDYQKGLFSINGQCSTARAAFVRYDVFSSPQVCEDNNQNHLSKPYGWYSTFLGACAATNGLRLPNAFMDLRANHKSFLLAHAQAHGLRIPRTHITNSKTSIEEFCEKYEAVIKPVAGGTYCVEAKDAVSDADWENNQAPLPVFLQEKLSYPEYRIFRMGDHFVSFEIHSKHLDYRVNHDNKIRYVENHVVGEGLLDRLRKMSDSLNIDFFACDFKSHPQTGELVFLELNSGPMFAAYDAAANGLLVHKMVTWLTSK